MAAPISARHEQCAWAITRSQKLMNAFDKGMITMEEYARSLADSAVAACDECMWSFVNGLPASLSVGLLACLEEFLEPVDFMPDPGPFIPAITSQEEIDRTRRQLRPKYIRFYEIMKNRVAAASGTSRIGPETGTGANGVKTSEIIGVPSEKASEKGHS